MQVRAVTGSDAGPPPSDVLDSAPVGGGSAPWSRWSAVRRRATAAALLVPVTAVLLVLGAEALQQWWQERRLRDVVAVQAELGVDASSLAWSPSGGGRVEYFLVLRNVAPRPASMTQVRLDHPGLTGKARQSGPALVPPGEVAYVPLSVQLDCRRWRPDASTPLAGSVEVVAASGRSVQVPTVVDRGGSLLGVVRTLCALDPDLRISELSGPVQSV